MKSKSLTELITEITTLAHTPLVRKRLNLPSQTIAANGIAYWNIYATVNSNCPSGYVFLGFVGFSSNHGSGMSFSVRYQDNQYSLEIWNRGSAAISSTPMLDVLYIKSGLLGT